MWYLFVFHFCKLSIQVFSLHFHGLLCISFLLITISYICCVPDFSPSYCWLFSFLCDSFDEQRFKKKSFIYFVWMCSGHTGPEEGVRSPGGGVGGGCEPLDLLCSYRAPAEHWLETEAKETFSILRLYIVFHRDISLSLPRSFWSMQNYIALFQLWTHPCSFVYLYSAYYLLCLH